MRYRVNLYREREERALRFRQGLLRGTLMGGAVGLEVILVGLLLFAGFQMRSRADDLRQVVAELETRAREKPDPDGLRDLRTLLRARLARVDWTGVLHAVAEATPKELLLTEIRGGVGGERGRMDGMELEGRLIVSSRELEPVFAFMEALKADSLIASRFPSVDLGTAQGHGTTFKIICRPSASEGQP